ncbi:MAG: 4-hydroxythreonine-4-phosphate dehydrogenase PdxA, partial [Kiritimatiellia bacterium]|nr:4-hydroxythreonine-4-phosphate dehydrogenase PdxA [Kiritimatiellia bacterium]
MKTRESGSIRSRRKSLAQTPARVRIGLTLGDWNGIGPETALRAAQAVRMGSFPDVELVLIGCSQGLSQQAGHWGLIPPPPLPTLSLDLPVRPNVSIWNPNPDCSIDWTPGRVTAAASVAARVWIEAGTDACLSGELDGLVTGPVCKEGFQKAGIDFPGHTELLAARTGATRVGMMLI